MKEYYIRFLPHWHPEQKWVFVTWKLAGSVPQNPAILTKDLPEGKRFALLDAEADRAVTGPLWLKDPRVAQIVADGIIELSKTLYGLAAWVIMANHVHIVILPKIPLGKIMQKLKGSTARESNQILGRTGAFWAIESYDHWIRTERDFHRVVRYVEWNPVRARLVTSMGDYQWSSAGQTKVCATGGSPMPFALQPAQ